MTDEPPQIPPQTLEPAHTNACPPDCSQRFWANVDSTTSVVIAVLPAEGGILGTFTTHAAAFTAALRSGKLCTLVPQVLDTPEWGNGTLH